VAEVTARPAVVISRVVPPFSSAHFSAAVCAVLPPDQKTRSHRGTRRRALHPNHRRQPRQLMAEAINNLYKTELIRL
jgi:hypothetical protein